MVVMPIQLPFLHRIVVGHVHRRPQNHNELFNHRRVVLRNHVERALGIIKKRFPILKVATFHKMENQAKIP
jgi:hypothetical protein